MIGIIDYGAGNLLSVKNALDHLGYESKYIQKANEMIDIDKLILPGVGSFGSCMKNIRAQNLDKVIIDFIRQGAPFLGICIGLQLLFDSSEESPDVPGMGILSGHVKKFVEGKVPQIGWNKISVNNVGLLEVGYVYFVNSYYVVPKDKEIIVATADYHIDFTAAIRYKNIYGTQFHPEKSSSTGIDFLERWLKL